MLHSATVNLCVIVLIKPTIRLSGNVIVFLTFFTIIHKFIIYTNITAESHKNIILSDLIIMPIIFHFY